MKSNHKLGIITILARTGYQEGCIAAHALDLIGDRWALLVVRELMLGPRRFGALRAGLPGLSANVLTQRLGDLEAAALLTRRLLPDPARVQVYALTEAGLALWPVLRALCLWGARQPGHDPTLFISSTALMLSMRAMCARDRAAAHLVEMRLGDDLFTIRTAPGQFVVVRGAAEAGALRFSGGTNAMAAAVYGPSPLRDTARGLIGFEGDLAEGQAFIDLFALR
ncbi:helix-turn-helix transcriptional regulator [Gemmobacter fulvus]|uniref:Helix-turn-helix transcriptional regulator n=1 Tax=Gemmobacter fulvus TaxID=2840474 RepID=A0A975S1F2_9RHOB|nr:helix-turn-helix domain-containing protein [Gemmobacter fulvus]MBT9247808.1 helix-turn-helix transcriptional regulator [Gemmobacter fulvus]QWK90005.1 helix-turn-helix transcriptional regulator [Gemmobacter fulvus]